jgi:hypothetical protein
MRKILFLICILGISCASLAQTDQASWAKLSALRQGQKIQVVDVTSKKHSGVFSSVSDTSISYKENATDQTTERRDVRSVKLMEHSHRLRNTLIGAGVGAGAGAGITAAAWEDHGFLGSKGAGAAVGAVIGGISGAIIGSLLPSHSTIYSAGSH